MAFREVIQALRGAMREVGMLESPQAQDVPQGFPRRHRGYQVLIGKVANGGKYQDRSRSLLTYVLTLQVSHRLRPTPEDGFEDLGDAGTDYERIIQALMGDADLNAQGLLTLGSFVPKVSKDGEWLEAPCSFSLASELDWLLDGGEETGS